MKKLYPLLSVLFLIYWGCVNRGTEIELTAQDLVGYDWVYPSIDSPLGAWKFNIDGTFNSSQKLFGGSTRIGKWRILEKGKILIDYNEIELKGIQLNDKDTLIFNSKSLFRLGSTDYRRY